MPLYEDVTFESLGAVKQEIREWLGPDAANAKKTKSTGAARDALVSVLMHSLAGELSNVRIRSQIQALLAELSQQSSRRFTD